MIDAGCLSGIVLCVGRAFKIAAGTLAAVAVITGAFFLGRASVPVAALRSSLPVLKDTISTRSSAPLQVLAQSCSASVTEAPAAALEKAPPGCAEWLAAVPIHELSNLLRDREEDYDRKYIDPFVKVPHIDEKGGDGGLGVMLAHLRGATKWTAEVPLRLGDRKTTAFLAFEFTSIFGDAVKDLSEQGYFLNIDFPRFGPEKEYNSMGTGYQLRYMAKKDDEYVVRGHFYGKTVPGFYSHAAITPPWSPSGGKLYLLDAKAKKWLEPISFTWRSVSEDEFKAFRDEVNRAEEE